MERNVPNKSTKDKEYKFGQLRKGGDGRVTRLFHCPCGTPVYRKDVTNHIIEIASKDRNQVIITKIKIEGKCEIKCPNQACDLWHIIV